MSYSINIWRNRLFAFYSLKITIVFEQRIAVDDDKTRVHDLQGLIVGPCFQLFGAWSTDEESSSLLTFSFSGFSFGTILIYPISGQLCNTNIVGIGGWPLIFYVPGTYVLYKTPYEYYVTRFLTFCVPFPFRDFQEHFSI